MQAQGAHIIADLHQCSLGSFAPTEESITALKSYISGLLRQHGLQELGNFYHFFGPGAVTATICLAESHLAFHTWPEDSYVSLDIFVCNRSVDTRIVAERIVAILSTELFFSGRADITRLLRSPSPALDAAALSNR